MAKQVKNIAVQSPDNSRTDEAAINDNSFPDGKGEVATDNNVLPSSSGEGNEPPDIKTMYRILSPLKYDGRILSAGDEVELALDADELALLVVEGLIEALEP